MVLGYFILRFISYNIFKCFADVKLFENKIVIIRLFKIEHQKFISFINLAGDTVSIMSDVIKIRLKKKDERRSGKGNP